MHPFDAALSSCQGMLRCLRRDYDEEDGNEADQHSPSPTFRRPPRTELPGTGLRRDRSASFRRLRAAGAPAKGAPWQQRPDRPTIEAEKVSQALKQLYEEASQARVSLASKLAQHSGMTQFSAEFADRAPPLELRILLPGLEGSIEQLLERLGLLGERLEALDLPAAGQAAALRAVLAASFASSCAEARASFEQQRSELRKLALQSPLFSPVTCPLLCEKLVAAMGARSPASTTASPGASGIWSTPPSSEATRLRLTPPALDALAEDDALSDDAGAADEVHSRPFSSIFAVHMVTEEAPAPPRR